MIVTLHDRADICTFFCDEKLAFVMLLFLTRYDSSVFLQLFYLNACGSVCIQAFQSILMMAEAREKHPEFCIPMTMIPATISNNVPGTDFTLGTDTALNAICDVSVLRLISYQLSCKRMSSAISVCY